MGTPSERDLLRRLLGHAPVVVLAVDASETITLCEGGGLPAGDLIGRPVGAAFREQPALVEHARRALRGERTTVEVEVRGAWWEVHCAPLTGETGGGATLVATDLTARRRAEEEARKNLWFLDSVVENLPDMIFVKDAGELRFVRFNRAGEELLGYRREDLIGKNDYDFFPREEADFFTSKDRAVLADGRLLDIPEETIHTRAGPRVLHTKKIPIADDGGRALYLLGISEDITERRQIEQERARLYERQRDLDRLKARLVANVSHEFRTPITLVLALVERLRGRAPSEEALADLAGVERHARVLLRLVSDLLDISRLEAGELKPAYAAVDLARQVRLAAAAFEVLAAERAVTLAVETPDALPAEVDPERVQRILLNLLGNAFRYAPRRGKIRCALAARDGRAVITVGDSGPGVPPPLRKRIFERFFQADPEAGHAGGAGLGLTIVKEFAELQGGAVSVGEAPEGGAEFVVELPLVAPAGSTIRPGESAGTVPPPLLMLPEDAPPPQAPAPSERARPRVLIVEDHREMSRFLEETLAVDHEVEVATDGRAGLARALERPPDLLLTDVMMPHLGGDALVRAVRARPELASVPIVVLTARADDELRVALLRAGAQDYLTKPFSTEELRARVRNLVAWKRASDLLRREVSDRGGEIDELVDELARRRRELQTALDSSRVACEVAERASRMKSDFLSLVSHELRTPVTSLKWRLQALERGMVSAEVTPAEHVRRMAAAAQRLYEMAESLLEYARIESGRLRTRTESVDLAAIAADVVEELRPEAEARGLALALRPSSLPQLDSDPRLLRLILTNLVGNAVKFTGSGSVEVTLASESGRHAMTVRDTGPGISEEDRGRIFEAFHQVESVSSKHRPGVGLGLTLVREMTTALGGTVEVESNPGAGSAFRVTVPSRAPAPAVRDPG